MKTYSLFTALCLSVSALAQAVVFSGGTSGGAGGVSTMNGNGGFRPGPTPPGLPSLGIGSLQPVLSLEPPNPVSAGLTFSYHGRSSAGTSFFSRTMTDGVHQQVFGYEILLEQKQPGTYLATFGKLPYSSLELATTGSNWRSWSVRDVTLPEPQVVHDGDHIRVELMVDATTGQKLVEDIKIDPYSRSLPPQLAARIPALAGGRSPSIPTAEGTARPFTAADAEMQIRQPRVTLNDTLQPATGVVTTVNGPLLWLYLPGHGRYILSLVPRPELGFEAADEVRGGKIDFKLAGDNVTVECPAEIASGHAPYILYVSRDPDWVPTASAQKGLFAAGSVDVGELIKLKQH